MSLDDFERCTPLEFCRIAEAHEEERQTVMREGWERTRVEVVSVANLFSKNRIDMKRAFPLPWDKDNESQVPKGTSSAGRMREMEERLRKTSTRSGSGPQDA